jgi:hypothetical protein
MGCCSSAIATPSYPGNKRVVNPSYQPPDDAFTKVDEYTSVAQVHFVTCPGGNALKLVGKDNRGGTNHSGPDAANHGGKYISVTLPPNVHAGDVIHVHAPDGRLNAVTVPEGMGPGSTFTVEFAPSEPSTTAVPLTEADLAPGVYVPTVVAEMDPADNINYSNNNNNNTNDGGVGDRVGSSERGAALTHPTS